MSDTSKDKSTSSSVKVIHEENSIEKSHKSNKSNNSNNGAKNA